MVLNPWTGDPLADVAAADPDVVDLAIRAARRAFDHSEWSQLPPADRGAMLSDVANGLAKRKQELATIEAANAGKPIAGAVVEIEGAIRASPTTQVQWINTSAIQFRSSREFLNFTLNEPLGVVGQIVPWNFHCLAHRGSWRQRWRLDVAAS